jgi:ribonuclease HII
MPREAPVSRPALSAAGDSLLAPRAALSASAAKLRLLKSLKCTTRFEKSAWLGGARLIAGVDEVGRGALFGCVAAAACILNPDDRIRGLRDSKLLTPDEREKLARRIRKRAIAWAVAEVDAARIDEINIYQASLLAMKLAVEQLQPRPDFLLVDAVVVDFDCPQKSIIHGDALSASIAAASILAKVHRDAILRSLDPVYPQYGLARNKGYGTRFHKLALLEHGPSPLHRQSWAPVVACARQQQFGLEFCADPMAEELEAELTEDVMEEVLEEAESTEC